MAKSPEGESFFETKMPAVFGGYVGAVVEELRGIIMPWRVGASDLAVLSMLILIFCYSRSGERSSGARCVHSDR